MNDRSGRRDLLFFDAVTCIREDLIEEAQNYVFRRRQVWKRYLGLAAGFLLVCCLGWNFLSYYLGWNLLSGLTASGGSSGMNGASSESAVSDCGTETGASDTAEITGAEVHVFTADVVEVNEDGLLVIPLPGNGFWTVADRVAVPADGAVMPSGIRPGDQVEIVFAGEALSGSVTGVLEITVLPQ